MIRIINITVVILFVGMLTFQHRSLKNDALPVDSSQFDWAREFRRSILQKVEKRQEPRSATHFVKKGETLASIWLSYGGSSEKALLADEALRKFDKSASMIRPGDMLSLSRNSDGEVIGLSRMLANGETIVLTQDDSEHFQVSAQAPKVETVERLVTGTITTSLSKSARDAGLSFSTIDDLVDLFSDRIDFSRDIQRGDTFSVVFSEKRVQRVGATAGDIEAALFRVNGKTFGAVRHVGADGKPRYFNEKGETQGNSFLRYPVQFTKITSVFSKARFHPILKITRKHPAVDFSAPSGTPVRSVADGVVEKAGVFGGAGNMIRIRHDARYTTVYRHLSRIGVKVGKRVSRGEVIGNVGQTGLATGPHLCFSVFKDGVYTDPLGKDLPQILDPSNKIPASVLSVALDRLRKHQDVMIIAQNELGLLHPQA